MAAPGVGTYSVSIRGKCVTNIVFDRLIRINLTLELGNIAQNCVDVKDHYKIIRIQAAKEETGPYKDVNVDEPAQILSDLGYRFLLCSFADDPDQTGKKQKKKTTTFNKT